MESFPVLPNIEYGNSKKEMAEERMSMAVKILEASGW